MDEFIATDITEPTDNPVEVKEEVSFETDIITPEDYSDLHAALDAYQSGEISEDEAATRIEAALENLGVEAEDAAEASNEVVSSEEVSIDGFLESRGYVRSAKKLRKNIRSNLVYTIDISETGWVFDTETKKLESVHPMELLSGGKTITDFFEAAEIPGFKEAFKEQDPQGYQFLFSSKNRKNIRSDNLPTAEENLIETETPIFTGYEEPVEGAETEVPNQTLDTKPVNDPTQPYTEVGGQETPIPVQNGTPKVTVETEVLQVSDTDLFENGEYNFDSPEIVAVEVPVMNEEVSQVLEMKEVEPGVYTLVNSSVHLNSHNTSFRKGKKAEEFLKSAKLQKSAIRMNLQNKVLQLNASNKALIFAHSNILGLIAVEAPLVKGIVNSKYALFTRKDGHLVSSTNKELISSSHSKVITSLTSNRGVKDCAISRDLFAEVERAYVHYLKNKNRVTSARARTQVKALESKVALLQNALKASQKNEATIKSSLENKIRETTQSLTALRQSVVAGEASTIQKANAEADREAARIRSEVNRTRVDTLSRMMGNL